MIIKYQMEAIIQELKSKIDIVDVARKFTSIKKSGETYKGPHPTHHSEKEQCLVIWPKTQRWHCFSCGSRGDVIDLLQDLEGKTLWEVLADLSAKLGIDLPHQSEEERAAYEYQQRVFSCLQSAAIYFHRCLTEDMKKSYFYLGGHWPDPTKPSDCNITDSYGFTPDTINEHLIGYAPRDYNALHKHLTEDGFSEEELIDSGMFSKNDNGSLYFQLSGRLIFPYQYHGKVVYMIGRATAYTPKSQEAIFPPKYKKLLSTPYIKNDYFFGEDSLRGTEWCLITEGVTDCISALQAGLPCISPVTTRFRTKDYPRLKGILNNIPTVAICNDAGEASQSGLQGALVVARELEAMGKYTEIVTLPNTPGVKIDLNQFLRDNPVSDFIVLKDNAKDLVGFMIERISPNGGVVPASRATEQNLYEILEVLSCQDPLRQERHLSKIKDSFGYSKPILRKQIKAIRDAKLAGDPEPANEEEIRPDEKQSAEDLLKQPDLLYRIQDMLSRIGIAGEFRNRLILYLALTSRILNEPLSILVKGESSAGKSFMVRKTMLMFPKDAYKELTDATPQSFFYLPEDSLSHKIIVIYELHGAERTDYTIRVMQSEGNLIIQTVQKNPITGELNTVDRVLKGPFGIITTTTKSAIHPENETRNLFLFPDETVEQTLQIRKATANKYRGNVLEPTEAELESWRNIQRVLQPYRVQIPYLDILIEKFPQEPIRVRRDFKRFLALIETIAVLHQFQREKVEVNNIQYLVASPQDYAYARSLIEITLLETIYQLNPKSRQVLNALRKLYKKRKDNDISGQWVEVRDIRNELGGTWSPSTVKKWLYPLSNAGYVDVIGEKGKSSKYRYNSERHTPNLYREILPSLEDVCKFLKTDIPVVHPIIPQEDMPVYTIEDGDDEGGTKETPVEELVSF